MSRRASLPSADALFGAAEREAPAPDTSRAADEDLDARAYAEVQRLVAPEGPALVEARDRAAGTVDVPPPEVCAVVRWAVAATAARTVVEVGAAGGVTGLWLLGRLGHGGVLTSIEPDPHAHGLASDALGQVAGSARVRSIHGDAATVLPRLSDASYDLVVLQTDPAGYPEYLSHARRLLVPGGMLLARGAVRRGAHADALARFLEELVEDQRFEVAVLPVDHGLVLATRAREPG